MRLSELRGVLTQLEFISTERGNKDPVVELFHQYGETEELTVDLAAINSDPAGNVTENGVIHIPLKEIIMRGYVVSYSDPLHSSVDSSIVIQAESKEHANKLFQQFFSTYTIKSISEEV